MTSSDFEELSSAFLSAFKAQKGSFFHPDIAISDLRSSSRGRGILATADIPPDTDLFIIPRDYVINIETSTLFQKIPELFLGDDDEVDETVEDAEEAMTDLPKPWLNLILVLIHEFLHRDTSKWMAYLDVLPEDFDTLMFWSSDELAQLQASAARGKIGKDHADAMFRKKILPVIQKHEAIFYPEGVNRMGEEELLRMSHRMGSLIMAYAFDLESENVEDDEDAEDGWAEDKESNMAMGMVPMADMLNADAEFNAHLEHGEKDLTMRSLREIMQGEEVLNYYGPLPNSDLLRRYGYTSEKHARYDVVEVEWALIKKAIKDVLGSLPKVAVEEEELEEIFVLERESGDPDETGINTIPAKFTTFPEEMVEQVTMFVSAALRVKGKPNEEQKRTLKQKFLQIMAQAIATRKAEYKTTIDEDEKVVLHERTLNRRRMAIDVRLGEKKLLQEVEQLLDSLLHKYAENGENGLGSERPVKKQKTRR